MGRLKRHPVEKRGISKTSLLVRTGEIHKKIFYNPMSARYADERDASTKFILAKAGARYDISSQL